MPRGMTGITIGRLVMARRGQVSAHLLRHEAVHVRQWRRYGAIGFPLRYAGGYVRWRLRGKGHLGAYRRIPMEIEADWIARRTGPTVNAPDTARPFGEIAR